MGWKPWIILIGMAALATPLVALSDAAPEVILATPGSAGGSGGAIERFTMRFSEAMVPLGDPRAASPINMKCAVGGTGRWVDPQTFVYDYEKPLPGGITCDATLRDGLASARGIATVGRNAFKIDTGGPSARAVLPGSYDGDIEEDQVFLIATNVAATKASVATAGYCAVDGIGEKIALDVLDSATATKLLGDLGTQDWNVRNFLDEAGLPATPPATMRDRAAAYQTVMAVKCRRPLPPGKDMSLVWASGIASADGRASGRDQRFDFTVRKEFEARFECSRVNPQAGCNPVKSAYVRFSADIPMAQAQAVRLSFPDGTLLSPKFPEEDKHKAFVSDLEFAGPLPAATKGNVTVPADVMDESGRKLANAQRFPLEIRIDEAPPLVKFAADFGIIEAKEGGVLPVTVRAVEPALTQRMNVVNGAQLRVEASDGEIAKWLRDIDNAGDSDVRTEKVGGEEKEVNYTGSASILGGKGSAISLGLPSKGKEFEVVGIPLKDPGFYVVEMASPALGRALLGRDAPRYVAAGALVTNMSVHFKWGREASLVWVTSLDNAAVVAGADIRVTDSCSGSVLARGTSDNSGRLIITSGLPAPETYGSCDGSESHPLMISARKSGDFSFNMTSWDKGISPSDFDLSYGYSDATDIIHTVFDRTLIKAGETINMKQILRHPAGSGFAFADGISGTLNITHNGSDTKFEVPFAIGKDGAGEASWTAPKGAPQGTYAISYDVGDETIYSEQTFQVDEFRLPTMRATISGPKGALVRPKAIPLDLFVGYLSGGGAPGLPVSIRTAFDSDESAPDGWDDWSFGGRAVQEGVKPLNGEGEEDPVPQPLAQTLPAMLGNDGTAKTSIPVTQEIEAGSRMTVEMDYEDANGETLTASNSLSLLPAAVRVGLKTDGWLMRDNDLRLRMVTVDPDGNPLKGRLVRVDVYSREVLTSRRRLIGGFYAYDNQQKTTKIGAGCTTTTDAQGLATCQLAPGISGEVTVVATSSDADGNLTRSVKSVWLAGEDEWWFGGDNGDRMDLVPEAKSYKAGETAKFQVRMPFRAATALVTVEREGVLSSFVTQISGKDPVVSVPMPGSYAPDVYVSVMAVRGRVGGFNLWLADFARDWKLPFFSREGASPTALVDLSKPSYRLGIAKVKVGWEAHQLGVTVTTDKPKYGVRETANAEVTVKEPDGKPARSAEIAFAAVDEALLQLSDNESWKILDAMMGERPISVLTSTAQTQVVGKRHYGKKAVEAGGGGGDAQAGVTRDDFKPMLLWRGRVRLDGNGKARIPVQLSEALSSFRLVAIATSGADEFGTGQVSVRTSQDLQLFSGLPPLVRTGDWFGASFTLRNASDHPMRVTATVAVTPSVAKGPPLTVDIPAGGAVPVTWNLTAPAGVDKLDWAVEAKSADGKGMDRIAVSQEVIPAVPTEVWAATLAHVGNNVPIPVMAPAGALAGGFVDVKLSDTLAPPLAGVRSYMAGYPYDCFEQRLSQAVVLGNIGAWNMLAGEIPAYMDGDGLLRYFPMERIEGSEALTAYALSMTSEAGFVIPDGPRAKMIEAMKAVVDGRLKRDGAWGGDARIIRIAALAALARSGEATPTMLGSNQLAPADMPTSALADWLVAIERTKGANTALRDVAERTLRQRLVYEGSRLDLADRQNSPWWMMVSTDEMAIKALIAVLGRPGWSDEGPKMMIGVSLRQLRGHWDTMPANAWGTIAARRFATLYPASAISGITTVSLGSQSKSQGWPMPSDAGPLRLPLPYVQTPLTLTQSSGGAGPWAMVSVSAAVPLTKLLFAGYKIEKQVSILSQKVRGQFTRGDVIKVSITVDATAERNWVVVSDPVPPGATIIGNIGGQSQILAGQAQGGQGGQFATTDIHGKPVLVIYGVQPAYVERGKEAWRGYFEWVPRGKFTTEYALRLNGTGQFTLPPTRVEAMYSPDIRAVTPNAPVKVLMR